MMDGKKTKWGKIWLFLFIGCCIQRAVYSLTANALENAGMEYRSWIRIMEAGVLIFIIPFSGIMALVFKDKEKRIKQAEAGCEVSASAFRYVFYAVLTFIGAAEAVVGLLFFSVFGNSVYEKEKVIGQDVMIGTKEIFLDSSVEGTYYRPYGVLLKKEYAYYEEPVILAVLGQRYGKKIESIGYEIKERENGAPYYVYELETEGEENRRFHGVPFPGIMPGYMDDYKEVIAIERGMEYALKNGIDRFGEAENAEYSALKRPVFLCGGEEDMEDCAAQLSGMIAYMLEEPVIRDKGIVIPVICRGGGEEEKTVTLGIGNIFGRQREEEYYAEKENVYQALKEAYDSWDKETEEKQRAEEDWERWEEEEAQGEKEGETADEEEMEAQGEAAEVDRNGMLTPEGAYKRLYQEVFEPEGDKYECCYNAKGNFYAVFGTGEETKDGEILRTRRTVVYDRVSRNDKCQLFVYYKEYYDENGLDRGTLILNFYAVDRSTGIVTAGEKTAWAETASAEYQEATGEK